MCIYEAAWDVTYPKASTYNVAMNEIVIYHSNINVNKVFVQFFCTRNTTMNF